jgi:propanediol utilization protein
MLILISRKRNTPATNIRGIIGRLELGEGIILAQRHLHVPLFLRVFAPAQ